MTMLDLTRGLTRQMVRHIAAAVLAVVVAGGALGAHAAEPAKIHRLLLAIDSADPSAMTLALHNAMAAKRLYDSRSEPLAVEVVAYGPGIEMLRADKSPVKELLDEASKAMPNIALSMCGNAKAAAEKREGHEITPLPGVKVVPAGIVRVMELEEQGWSYVKP